MRDFQLPGRSPVYATGGMAATSHPLATLAALDLLRSGGNAADAAVAACAVQCVVEPQSTGIGGDCFVLYAPASGGVVALNGSGWAPGAATPERLRSLGVGTLTADSVHSITVPGAVRAWDRLLERYGRRGLTDALQPAIHYAEEGFVVHPRVAFDWARAAPRLSRDEITRRLYLPGGRAPEAGRLLRFPALANSLRRISENGSEIFYRGELAERMVDCLRRWGGLHEIEDFAAFEAEFVDPIHGTYHDLIVYECPPNGQGIVALLMLNILEGCGLAERDPHGAERFHLEAEAARLAFRDRDALLADPRTGEVPVRQLLDKAYAARLRQRIDPERRMEDLPPPLFRDEANTVYVSVVDGEGNACSFINSLYDSFGSARVCADTGILFHCRGRAFRLDPSHPNVIAPRKRPMHTIIPGLAFRGGELWACFGVMGADYQPVGHAHLLTNLVEYAMDPQQALDSPRAMAYPGDLEVERGVPVGTREGLRRRGHRLVEAEAPLGGGQCILVDRRRGMLIGGSDPRKDGIALGF